MKRLHLVFMGTPAFAVPSLELFRESGHRLAAVVTRPDRPRGRGRKVRPSPVKEWALRHEVEVCQPFTLKDPAFRRRLTELSPDLVVTAAYGRILPPELLDFPPLGCINLHASLLPSYRGAAPIHRAIMEGATETGVSVIVMSPEMDAGNIIMQEAEPILAEDTAGSLHDRLAAKGARLLVKTADALAGGTARAAPQDPASVSFAPPLHPAEEILDWRRGAVELFNQVRGMNPWPGAYTTFNNMRLKVWRAAAPEKTETAAAEPGTVLGSRGESLCVAAGDFILELLEVQPAGKRTMTAGDFYRGYRLSPGLRLG